MLFSSCSNAAYITHLPKFFKDRSVLTYPDNNLPQKYIVWLPMATTQTMQKLLEGQGKITRKKILFFLRNNVKCFMFCCFQKLLIEFLELSTSCLSSVSLSVFCRLSLIVPDWLSLSACLSVCFSVSISTCLPLL